MKNKSVIILGDKIITIPKKFDLDKKYFSGEETSKFNPDAKKLFELFKPELQATRKEQGMYCSKAGVHDWLLCYRGLAGSVELKTINKKGEDNQPTPLQKRWGREAEAAERIVGYAWTLGDVLKIILLLHAKYTKFVCC